MTDELLIADRWGRTLPGHQYRKAKPPKIGEKYGLWAGRDDALAWAQLPGGAVLQFDLERLTMADYRVMRSHYQVNASIAVLTFMLHQIDWHIECDDQRIVTNIEENIREVWGRLVRGMSQAYWAGYSPMVLEWENDIDGRALKLNKVKDLIPEECNVNWKEVKGYAPPNHVPPKLYIYDGIKQAGVSYPYPPESTFWYPLLMENGDYYGKKLLKPAFPSWFFSQLIHLFANRYYERFGEPLPVGRADFDATVEVGDESMNGREAMTRILQMIRSRAVAVLPSDRDPETKEFDYDIDYLESEMRGGDFEKYLSRLDEEISLALFTPVLMFRTGDTGSYNLGVQHGETFKFMLNALADDMKEYIDRYIVQRLKGLNFSVRAPRAEWVHREMGKDNAETMRAIVSALIQGNLALPDLTELGQAIGIDLTEVDPMDVKRKEQELELEKAKEMGEIEVEKAKNMPQPDTREVRDRPSTSTQKPGRSKTSGSA